MSVLDRETFFSRINAVIGTDSSDESISFVEDMTDTYNHLEKVAQGDGTNWEERYNELDKSWREKYRRRFFSSNGNSAIPDQPQTPQEQVVIVTPETISVNDLFN